MRLRRFAFAMKGMPRLEQMAGAALLALSACGRALTSPDVPLVKPHVVAQSTDSGAGAASPTTQPLDASTTLGATPVQWFTLADRGPALSLQPITLAEARAATASMSSNGRFALESADDKFVIREIATGKVLVQRAGRWPRWVSINEVAFLNDGQLGKIHVDKPRELSHALNLCSGERARCNADSMVLLWSDASLDHALLDQILFRADLHRMSPYGALPFVYNLNLASDGRAPLFHAVSHSGAVCVVIGEQEPFGGIGVGLVNIGASPDIQKEAAREQAAEEAANRVKSGIAALWCSPNAVAPLQHVRDLAHRGVFPHTGYDSMQFVSEAQLLLNLPSDDKCVVNVATAEAQCTRSPGTWHSLGDGRWVTERDDQHRTRSIIDIMSRLRFNVSAHFIERAPRDTSALIAWSKDGASDKLRGSKVSISAPEAPSTPLSSTPPHYEDEAISPKPLNGGNTRTATLRQGSMTVNGRLAPEIIQRLVRQNFGHFRTCYGSSNASGTMTTQFIIDRSGAVMQATNLSSNLPPSIVQCVVNAFKNLSFPQPEGGVVTVTYPLLFENE